MDNKGLRSLTRAIIGMDDAVALKYMNDMMDQSLRSYLDKQYEVFDNERTKVNSIDAAKEILNKEQNFLIKTSSQLKSPLSNYGNKVEGDLIAIHKILEDPSLLNKSFALADQIIEEKILPESKITEVLLSSRDMEIVHDKLEMVFEKHKIYVKPENILLMRANAKTVSEALEVIDKEQNHFLNLQKTLKHNSLDEELSHKCALAEAYEKKGMNNKLSMVIKDLLRTKEISESAILSELQMTRDITSTYKQFDIKLETIEVNKAISNLSKEKNNAKTIDDVVLAIKGEEDYLLGLDETVKYREYIDPAVTSSIKSAKQNKKDNMMDELNKLSKFMIESKGYTNHEPAIKALKSASNTKEAYGSLLSVYHNYFTEKVKTGIDYINEGKTLVFDKQKWTCPIEFIDHVMKTANKHYTPHKELKILRSNVLARTKDLEIGGPEI